MTLLWHRVRWAVCGHAADAPAGHDWDGHRHPCPECGPGGVDRRCTGVEYRNVTWTAPAAVRPARCFLCRATPARPYPVGLRCDGHRPGVASGAQEPHTTKYLLTYAPTQVHTVTTGGSHRG